MTTYNIGNNTNIPCDYTGLEDAWLHSGNPTYNYGGLNFIQATGDTSQLGLMVASGLSNLPTNFVVSGATLHIYCHDSNGGLDFKLRRLLRSWVEGTQSGADRDSDTPHSCCWNEYGNNNAWTTAGALSVGNGVGYDVSSINTLTQTYGNDTAWYDLTSAQLITDVQDMISNPSTNYGWQVYSDDSSHSGNAMRYSTRDDSTAANRPYLTVVGSIPSGKTVDGIACSKVDGVSF